MNPIDYYQDESQHGSYKFVPLSKIIDDFVYDFTDDDSILKNTRRTKIIKQCKDSLRELNKSTFNEEKAMEITVTESLYITMPHDYVGIKGLYVVVNDEITNTNRLKPLNRNTNINIAVGVLQDEEGEILFDDDGRILTTDSLNAYNKPYKRYEFTKGGDNKKVSKYGEYILDENKGEILFSSNMLDEEVVLIYRTDGLQFDTYGEDEIKVHKDMIEVLNNHVYYKLIHRKRTVSRGEKLDALNRFKTTRHEAKLNKLKLNFVELFRKSRNANY